MQRLTIDALPLLGEGGITNYIRSFVGELIRQTTPQWRTDLLFRLGFHADRKKSLSRLPAFGSAKVRTLPLPDAVIHLLWERGWFAIARRQMENDLFLATTELVPRCKKATVGYFFYDIVPLMIPDKYTIDQEQYALALFNRLRNADFVITISHTSKKDLIERFKYPEEKIVITYPGCEVKKTQEHPSAPASRTRPYILYMGALALNKNVDGLIRIFARCVHEHGLDYDLILTGRDFCGKDFWRDLMTKHAVTDRVRFAGWVSEQERSALLAGATMLWQFSWYEGFGLPVLEAAAAGIPVLHSNRASLKEILQNPEQEIDPDDEGAAAAKAARALSSPQVLEAWKERGLRRAAGFSWERSIRDFLEWYRNFTMSH
jgi:glycosyltransferase involved in cell wall biosynthesis